MKVFDEKEGTGHSAVFTAHWYPLVTLQIAQTGNTDMSYDVEGSLDNAVWDVVLADKTETVQNIADKWFLYWRINLKVNGASGKVTATMGCGGA